MPTGSTITCGTTQAHPSVLTSGQPVSLRGTELSPVGPFVQCCAIVLNTAKDGALIQPQVLENGVTVRTSAWCTGDGSREIGIVEPHIPRGKGKAMPAEAVSNLIKAVGVIAQEVREERSDSCQLAVVRRTWVERLNGVKDLVT